MKIFNASSKTLNKAPSTLPNVADALNSWMQKMTVCLVCKTVVNFQLVETSVTKEIMAVRQPLNPRDLQIKPEGQRAWGWEMLHVRDNVQFVLDSIVTINGERFRIMRRFDYPEYGYISYECCKDFTP